MKKPSKLIQLATLGLVASTMGSLEANEEQSVELIGLVCSPHHCSPHACVGRSDPCTLPSKQEVDALMAQLNKPHQIMFHSMDCQGQRLAIQLANQTCRHKNTCAGLNSCATAKNSCMGQGSCKGRSPGPFKDKNKAVEVASVAMAKKRQQAMGR